MFMYCIPERYNQCKKPVRTYRLTKSYLVGQRLQPVWLVLLKQFQPFN